MEYIVNPNAIISFNGVEVMSALKVVEAIEFSNKALKTLNDTTQELEINIFEVLGMRNLSGIVGEYFARSIMRMSGGKLQSNLHQDGYPDLCLTDTETKRIYYRSLYVENDGKKYPLSKEAFSPYKFGGIEVKATCGSTPSASKIRKPIEGEQRVALINSFDWKAHHRETNHLLAVLWDFIEGNPTIVAAFFQDSLTIDDWGKIVKPKKDGGRTTSVSIMTSNGVRKMCNGWVAVIDVPAYIDLLSNRKWIGYRIK